MTSEVGYKTVKERVKKAEKFLEGKWTDPFYGPWLREHDRLTGAMLEWEAKTGVLFDEIDKWEKQNRHKY